VILSLIGEPLLPLLVAGASGALHQPACRLTSEKLVAVVLASRGYPESSESGRPISGIGDAERLPGVQVYHAGTSMQEGQLVTAGGRVLTVVGRGETLSDAMTVAYEGVSRIRFEGMQFRRDIGRRALNYVSAGTTSEPGR
jgi:phosphoribosylamine--glycine ligase